MDAKSEQASGSMPNTMPVPEGFRVPDLGLPVNQAASMGYANPQFASTPQTFAQHPQQMYDEGSRFLGNEMRPNLAMPSGVVHFANHSMVSNFGLQQPNGEDFFHPGHQTPQNFVQQSNGPNFFPGHAVINLGNHFHQGHGMMPNSNPQQYSMTGQLNQEGMVRHPSGQLFPARDVLQKALDGSVEASQAAERANWFRMKIKSIGSCPPPRVAHADKRRLHEHGTSRQISSAPGMHTSNFKQEDMFADSTQRIMNGIPVAQGFDSPGGYEWASYNGEMTPTQRKNSMASNSMSRSLSAPKSYNFDDVSTPDNFKHQRRISDPATRERLSKRQKTSGLHRNATWPQHLANTSLMSVPGPTTVPLTPVLGPDASDSMPRQAPAVPSLMSVPGPTIPLAMPAPDQITASLVPISGPPVSCQIPAMQNEAHPAEPQVFSPLLSLDASADAALLSPLGSNTGSVGQNSAELSPDQILLQRLTAANREESITATLPEEEQGSLQSPRSTVTEAIIQEGALPAGNLDVGPPVFGGGEFFPPNSGVEGQNSSSNISDPLEDASYYDGFDEDNDDWAFNVSYSKFRTI
jgi:hypothetical protein